MLPLNYSTSTSSNIIILLLGPYVDKTAKTSTNQVSYVFDQVNGSDGIELFLFGVTTYLHDASFAPIIISTVRSNSNT